MKGLRADYCTIDETSQFFVDEIETEAEKQMQVVAIFPADSDDMEMFGRYFNKFEVLASGAIMILDERSSMKKAVKITEENKSQLTLDYDLTEDELDEDYGINVGLWLVADFGASRPDGYLTETAFNESFDIVPETDMKMQNGYVAIVDKGTYTPLFSEG